MFIFSLSILTSTRQYIRCYLFAQLQHVCYYHFDLQYIYKRIRVHCLLDQPNTSVHLKLLQ